jgi:hypothetical protein
LQFSRYQDYIFVQQPSRLVHIPFPQDSYNLMNPATNIPYPGFPQQPLHLALPTLPQRPYPPHSATNFSYPGPARSHLIRLLSNPQLRQPEDVTYQNCSVDQQPLRIPQGAALADPVGCFTELLRRS